VRRSLTTAVEYGGLAGRPPSMIKTIRCAGCRSVAAMGASSASTRITAASTLLRLSPSTAVCIRLVTEPLADYATNRGCKYAENNYNDLKAFVGF